MLSKANRPVCWGLAALVVMLAQGTAVATPDVNVSTYDQWVAEIGPGGHISAIPTWDTFGFENLYSGESSSFAVPTLIAVPDDNGHPALHTDYGSIDPTATVIGGFMYTYASADDANWVGTSLFISIKKMPHWTGPANKHPKWSFDVASHARMANWEFDIPELTGAPGEDPWAVFSISFPDANPDHATTPPTQEDPLVSLTDVTCFGFDYKGDKTINIDAYGIDHIFIVPEPAALSLLALGMFPLFGYRRIK